MADLKISQLPVASGVSGDETITGLQSGANVQFPISVVADYAVQEANLDLTTLTQAPGILSPNNGILIPLYGYPNNPYSDAQMQRLIGLIRTYHNVPVICIINPGSGPGTVWDGNYAALITLLQASGATVIGYVSTKYAARDPDAVKADVQTWHTLYNATPISGIFFDEFPYDPGTGNTNVLLYESYYNYVKSLDYSIVIGNPGTNEQTVWYQFKTADIIVTWENSAWPSTPDMQGLFVGGHSNFDWRVNALLVYNQPSLDTTKLATMMHYVKWLFITDDNLPNPWDTLGTYFESLFAAISTSNAGSQNVIASTITLTAPQVIMPSLPTSDPHVANALYLSAGTLKMSAG